jgi:ectoine hydroxylase-related dioxygenase (phytanoyl-CoA dioxygenase family)
MFCLTEQQQRFFDTFGYLKFEGMFAPDIEAIQQAFTRTVEQGRAEMLDWCHQAHDHQRRQVLTQFIDRDAYLSSLIDDERIKGVFSSLMGDDFCYRGSDANLFDCATCWHSDTYGALLKYRNVKLIFYLDPLEADTGCFRVIPGSHLFGDRFANKLQSFLKNDDSFLADLGLQNSEIPCQIIPTQPGDVVAFDFRVKHATHISSPQHRRMFNICAAEKIQDEDIPRLRELIAAGSKLGLKSYYGAAMLATAGPDRMRHLQQCLDNEDALTQCGS